MSESVVEDPQIARLLMDAQQAQKRGDAAAAKRSLERVLAEAPDHAAALNSLGMLALGRGDFVAADELFTRAATA